MIPIRWALILLTAGLTGVAWGQAGPGLPGAPEWPSAQAPGGPAPPPGQAGYPGQPSQLGPGGPGQPSQGPGGPGGPGGPQAQDPNAQEPGVARISVMQGDVSVQRGDSGETVAAAVNAPLVVGDHLLTSAGARAEAQFDYSNMIRLGPNTDVRFSQLDYRRYQVQIGTGTIVFRVLREDGAQTEIDTPSVAVRPMKAGVYRVTVNQDGTSQITVRSGSADIYTPKGSEELRAGKTMMARGPASDPEFQVAEAIPADEFDHWNQERDQNLERLQAQAYQHVSPDVYGAEDLDPYGRWVNDPSYGYVWAPTVPVGWAPYRSGRWMWEDYYGWTWVSYDPWGWAPYHYGRWYMGSVGWCWWPGPMIGRAYWSPALVGFFGFGGGFGFGFGFGNVGWVPLAPFEPFHRWWGPGFYGGYGRAGFYNRTTIVNNVNIMNTYRNARVMNGVTAMNSSQFGRAAVGAGNMVRPRAADLQRAGAVRGMLPVTPGRESLAASNRSVNAAAFPRTSAQQRFFSHSTAPPVSRASFEQQRQGMERLSQNTFGGARGTATGFGQSRSAVSGSAGGWPRAGQVAGESGYRGTGSTNSMPARNSTPTMNRVQPSASPGGATNGWQRFGGVGIEGRTATPSERGAGGGSPGRGYAGGNYSSPRSNYSPSQYNSPRESSPVRINPPIVSQRGGYSGSGSYGGSHPSFGRPEVRSSGGGGGYRGGGGGSSHGGGGGHSGRR